MPVVWSDHHRLHDPGGAIWVGVQIPGDEVPARAERIRDALAEAGARFVEASSQPEDAMLDVHDSALVAYLAHAWEEWEASGLTADPGQDRVVPYVFPHPGLLADRPPAAPAATTARAGYFAFDTMTLIGPGTWEAARAAVDVAAGAADLVIAGEPVAYACCRPPGHHVTRTCFGGSCYLNNAAGAAARLRDREIRVAVIDVDAHHGNGTQSIFYEDPDVLTGSVHVDPGAGWFPHFLGFADETGTGDGVGTNLNLPVPPGSGDEAWLDAVKRVADWVDTRGIDALVVALGVDAAAGDPESPLEVTSAGYRAAGRELGALGVPTAVVLEGGYELETIGGLVSEALAGIEEGAGSR
jgi:acetoin utilization deacetylase AcuC-like enzyme